MPSTRKPPRIPHRVQKRLLDVRRMIQSGRWLEAMRTLIRLVDPGDSILDILGAAIQGTQVDARQAGRMAARNLQRIGYTIDARGRLVPPDDGRNRGKKPPVLNPEIMVQTRMRHTFDRFAEEWKRQNTQWIECPESSNVYGFTYDELGQILYVQYKAEGRKDRNGRRPHVPGPIYSYGGAKRPIPPTLFAKLKRANSKGTFVWDELRIRGTMWGHKFPYTLVQATPSTMYVPRKATKRGLAKRIIPTTIKLSNRRKVRRYLESR